MTRRAKMRMGGTNTRVIPTAGQAFAEGERAHEKLNEIRCKPEETIGNLSYGPPDVQGMKDRIAQLELECVELDRANEEERKAYEERITTLEKELMHAEGQVHATKNHRLQTIAAPIVAELMGSMYRRDGIVTQELDSVAHIAIQAAQCLLTELERKESQR